MALEEGWKMDRRRARGFDGNRDGWDWKWNSVRVTAPLDYWGLWRKAQVYWALRFLLIRKSTTIDLFSPQFIPTGHDLV